MTILLNCDKCGATGLPDEDAVFWCSSTATLICNGHPPEPGCGTVLTPEDRHWYGDCCNDCEMRWGDRMDAWANGKPDPDLDAIFGAPVQEMH